MEKIMEKEPGQADFKEETRWNTPEQFNSYLEFLANEGEAEEVEHLLIGHRNDFGEMQLGGEDILYRWLEDMAVHDHRQLRVTRNEKGMIVPIESQN